MEVLGIWRYDPESGETKREGLPARPGQHALPLDDAGLRCLGGPRTGAV